MVEPKKKQVYKPYKRKYPMVEGVQVRFDSDRKVSSQVREWVGDVNADKGWPYIEVDGKKYYLIFGWQDVVNDIYEARMSISIVSMRLGNKYVYWKASENYAFCEDCEKKV